MMQSREVSMNDVYQQPLTERISIAGPAGQLEALIETPANPDLTHMGVVCHPHPLHGGTMTNKVAYTLARTINDLRIPAVRFNFRGVGASEGQYADGIGEVDDALAAIEWARKRWPEAQLWLAGFSFGGAVALRTAGIADAKRLVTVAPAVAGLDSAGIELPQCPWLVVQGDQDELVNIDEVRRWTAQLKSPPDLAVLQGAEHFFHGRLTELRDVVRTWLQQ
jgi:alpha/beta superfamily hydrolase